MGGGSIIYIYIYIHTYIDFHFDGDFGGEVPVSWDGVYCPGLDGLGGLFRDLRNGRPWPSSSLSSHTCVPENKKRMSKRGVQEDAGEEEVREAAAPRCEHFSVMPKLFPGMAATSAGVPKMTSRQRK